MQLKSDPRFQINPINAVKLLKNNKELMFIIAGKPVRGYDMQALRYETKI